MRKESNETEKLSGYLVSNLPYEDNEEFDSFIIKAFGARRELLAALISEQADYYRQRDENTHINKETIPTNKQELIKFNKANKYGYYFAKDRLPHLLQQEQYEEHRWLLEKGNGWLLNDIATSFSGLVGKSIKKMKCIANAEDELIKKMFLDPNYIYLSVRCGDIFHIKNTVTFKRFKASLVTPLYNASTTRHQKSVILSAKIYAHNDKVRIEIEYDSQVKEKPVRDTKQLEKLMNLYDAPIIDIPEVEHIERPVTTYVAKPKENVLIDIKPEVEAVSVPDKPQVKIIEPEPSSRDCGPAVQDTDGYKQFNSLQEVKDYVYRSDRFHFNAVVDILKKDKDNVYRHAHRCFNSRGAEIINVLDAYLPQYFNKTKKDEAEVMICNYIWDNKIPYLTKEKTN